MNPPQTPRPADAAPGTLVSDYDYVLPPELIAQQPVEKRDTSRLLVLERATRTRQDESFLKLPSFLRSGDVLVLNETRVIPARLRALRERSGGKVEIFLLPLTPQETVQQAGALRVTRRALTRSGGRLIPGESMTLERAPNICAVLLERLGEAGDVLEFSCTAPEFEKILETHGEIPLPPYIKRAAGPSSAEDRQRYQTVFAQNAGAVAAPTAGLHFTPEIFAELAARGVECARLTLHVGPGTFKTVKTERVEEHRVDPEPLHLGAEAAEMITRAKREQRRVIAVGTTALRGLESSWDAATGAILPCARMTDLFIRPPFTFHVADGLLTNFHLPRSSLLMLAAAFAAPGSRNGLPWLLESYAHAVQERYRFFSYGDASLFI